MQKYNVIEIPTGTVSLSVLQPGLDASLGLANKVDPDVTHNWISNKNYCKSGLDKGACDTLKRGVRSHCLLSCTFMRIPSSWPILLRVT